MPTRDSSTRRIVERLQDEVDELRRIVNTVQRDGHTNETRQTFLAVTTCDPDLDPSYPEAPADTFRIAFIDARFDPTPGQQATLYKVRHRPTAKYSATARNISGGWLPKGTPVLATWQRCFGGSANGEWWIQHASAGGFVKATLSKPLRHSDAVAYLKPGAVDVASGLPVSVFQAGNDWLHWQGLIDDTVILKSTFDGWQVWQPRMHNVCAVVDVVDSPDADSSEHPGALTKVELGISTTMFAVPDVVCAVVEYTDCVEGSGSESGSAEFTAPSYVFEYDKTDCCGTVDIGSGSEHSGPSGGGSCETGEGMTGEF